MEEVERNTVLTISHLVQRARPLTAASSLVPVSPICILKPHRDPDHEHRPKPSFSQCRDPNHKTLIPLNQPTLLIGTLTLPSFAELSSPIKCNCFQFSDGSATICSDVLDFDPKMIGIKIRILAWNFIPLKCGNKGVKSGYLEIITWDFHQACWVEVCFLSSFSSVCLNLGSCNVTHDFKMSGLVFGVILAISPISVVPCASSESGSRNISGFLVDVLVCQCKICASEFLVSELKDLSEINVKDHVFSKTVIVYFCGLPSSWHPVISRFIGDIVLLMGLKKKLVYIRKEESQLMYVTTDEVSLHVAKLNKRGFVHNKDIRGKVENDSYSGIITGSYMQGMVVELDQDVILLLTDQHLTVPHCVRVGAIVTLKNVHFVDPKFTWGEMLILGACYRTSVHVKSFSPLETGCRVGPHSQSLLQKFIDSLSFAARLWALLVISGFKKKFAGILSEKDILGSKHCSQKEGLAQKYASSHLPLSAFQCRQGIMLEFCKHLICGDAKEAQYSHLRLVLPIANLISYCEASWKKILDGPEEFSKFVGCTTPEKALSCGGRTHAQSLRSVLRTGEIGVIVPGKLKVSLSSGRLQLVDATGEVDIMTDLPATWDSDRIFEANDFRLIMEGMPPKLADLDSTIYRPLSCRSIFSNAPTLRRVKMSIYLYHYPTDEDSWSRSLFFDSKENHQELCGGKFHLLRLTHKFPMRQKFQGVLPKRSNMFADAIVLPWDLLVNEKHGDARFENHLTHKRCKLEQTLVEVSNCGLNDAGNGLSGQSSVSCSSYSNYCTEQSCVSNFPLELSCLIASRGVICHCMGMLCCTNERAKNICCCKLPRRKVLLEFGPDSFYKYEIMKIGRYYLVKHQEGDMLCSTEENYQVSRAKVNISSVTHLRSLTFSSIEIFQSSDISDILSSHNSHISSDEVIPKGYRQFGIPCLTHNGIDSRIYSDINVFVPFNALNLLENVTRIWDGDHFKGEKDFHGHGGSVINTLQASENSCSGYPSLPEGNLTTLHGVVAALHDCNGDAFPGQPRPRPGECCLPMFLQGNGGVCVHVMVDNRMVRIFCDRSKQTYPVGLGRDACATFHRILVLRGQNKYMMTPVSFITINDIISLANGHLTDEFNNADGTMGLISVPTPNTIPATLIHEALQFSEPKPVQFRCRVVGVYILVVEKPRTTTVFQSSVPSVPSPFGIPFAGFVVDDGTSWTIGGNFMDAKAYRWLEERLTEVGVTFPPLLNIWATSVGHTYLLAEARSIIEGLLM
ncbi:hypothetical protein OROHE_008699 [Orobanche hederae]